MHVAELMTTRVVSCTEHDDLSRAAQLLWDHDLGCVPVVDAHGRVVGVVTDRDICMAGYTQGRPLSDIPVAVAMARDVVCCTEREDVVAVERRMAARQVRRLPVVDDDGDLMGIVSLADLAKASARGAPVPAGAVAAVLAGVGEPHRPLGNGHPLAA